MNIGGTLQGLIYGARAVQIKKTAYTFQEFEPHNIQNCVKPSRSQKAVDPWQHTINYWGCS